MISLTLPYPPTVNGLYLNARGKGRIKSPEYRAWLLEAGMRANIEMAMAANGDPIKGPYRLLIEADRPDRRARDIANLEKATSDLLVKQGIVRDDSDAEEITLRWRSREPVKGARVYLTVTAV